MIESDKAKLLVYGVAPDSPEGLRIRELAAEKNISVQQVSAEDFSQKLGFVAGLEGYSKNEEKYSGEKPQHSILWFDSVPRETLSWFLHEYSSSKDLKSIDLKSVLTEHNVNWTLAEHYEELKAEHQVMRAYTLLSHAQAAYESLDEEDFSDESFSALRTAVSRGNEYIQAVQEGKEVKPDEIDRYARAVKEAYENLRPRI